MQKLTSLIVFVSCICANAQNAKQEQTIHQNWQFHQVGKTEWYLAQVPGNVHTDLQAHKIIADPFLGTIEKDIQWVDKEDWEYKTEFEITDNQLAYQNIELEFKGLDTYADVYLNNQLIIKASNMFRGWKYECRKLLKSGKNNLRVYFNSPIKMAVQKYDSNGYRIPVVDNDKPTFGGVGNKQVSVYVRKPGYHFGWDLTPRIVTSGIWRPVILRTWNDAKIENIQYVQKEVKKEVANFSAKFEIQSNAAKKVTFEVVDTKSNLLLASKEVELAKGINRIPVEFSIKNPKLWWTNGLGDPYLYALKALVKLNDQIIDNKTENIGVRTLQIVRKPDAAGTTFYVELNGVPVFMKGSDYVPNDQFAARVAPEHYKKIIKSAAEAHMNMIRVWGGGFYENDILYDLCDENGILVWQDFMFACSLYPGDQEFLDNVEAEAEENVKRLRNHPCIALWCGNNESEFFWITDKNKLDGLYADKQDVAKLRKGYDDLFYKVLAGAVDKYDSQRLFWGSSPMAEKYVVQNNNSGDRHYWDVWFETTDFNRYNEVIPRFVSEYGFVSFPDIKTVRNFTGEESPDFLSDAILSHQKSPRGNEKIKSIVDEYYHFPLNIETIVNLSQLIHAEAVKTGIEAHRRNMPYCMGSIYWQLNDVWPCISWSGIDYYGNWKAPHYYAKKAFSEVLLSTYAKEGKVGFYVVSDRLEPIKADLKIVMEDFKGKQLYSKEISVEIPKNSSNKFFEVDEAELLKGLDKTTIVLNAVLGENGHEIASGNYYFAKPKELKLADTKPEIKIARQGADFNISISSAGLVKSVCLTSNKIKGHFTENYFDILPGQTINLLFQPEKPVDDIKNDLTLFTINEWNSAYVEPPVVLNESGKILMGDSIFIQVNPNLQKRFDKIVYTTDGTNPTAQSSVFNKFLKVDKDLTFKCMILTNDNRTSEIVTANFVTTNEIMPSVGKVKNTVLGISFKYYEAKWDSLPDFSKLVPQSNGVLSTFNLNEAKIPQFYGFEFNAWYFAPKDGIYTFWLSADDGSKLYIDGTELINIDGMHSTIEKSVQVGLQKGFHKVYIPYFNALYGGNINVNFRGPGGIKTKLDDKLFNATN